MQPHVAWYLIAFVAACAAGGIAYAFWSWQPLGLGWLFAALVLVNVAVACVATGIGRRTRRQDSSSGS